MATIRIISTLLLALSCLTLICCKQQPEPEHPVTRMQVHADTVKPRFLTYGLPEAYSSMAIDTIAKRWGIEYVAVAGCDVNDKLLDSIKQYNNRSDSVMKIRFGQDWEKRFDKEVEAEIAALKKRNMVKTHK